MMAPIVASQDGLAPPTRRARLIDVARKAGVSRGIAGHVLNGGAGNSRVSAKTAQRIREIAKRLNYHPNHAARLLRGKRSSTFGLLVASAGDPLRSFLVQHLDTESVKIGCHTFIANTIGDTSVGPDLFAEYVEEFARRGVDGVFCAVHHWFGGDRAQLLARHPHTIFYEDSGPEDAARVSIDREEAARLAVRHLVERGRKRIGLAAMSFSRSTHFARRIGYEKELQCHGLMVDEQLLFNGEPHGLAYAYCNMTSMRWEFPMQVIEQAVDALVIEGRADAIVAHDDFWAAALIKCLHARHIRVPEDVAVVGYLNHYLADWTDPALTTLDLQHELAAKQMVSMMKRMIEDGPLPVEERVVQIKPRLIVRESS
jgi:DNA-binding LacI/PurR family transcriptional regulator